MEESGMFLSANDFSFSSFSPDPTIVSFPDAFGIFIFMLLYHKDQECM
jgi:hypothetical protein